MASPEASAARLVGAVILFVGLAAFGALLWICRRVIASERAWDVGDLAILSVFALFGAFCLWAGWRLLRSVPEVVASSAAAERTAPPARRVTVSHGFAAVGVALMILAVLIPEQWYPVLFLFGGLGCLVVSHVLTPCEERMEKLRKARASMRQL